MLYAAVDAGASHVLPAWKDHLSLIVDSQGILATEEKKSYLLSILILSVRRGYSLNTLLFVGVL